VRFGLVLPIQVVGVDLDQLWDEIVEEVQAAERAGFDAVFLPEFHQSRGGALVSPMLLGAALLQATERIRFSAAVLALPLHHPVRLAEDLLMLDWISGGRAFLGVGIGHQVPDFTAYDVDRDSRGELFEESMAIVTACLAGAPFTFEGKHLRSEAAITPRPRTQPRPEIWVAAHSRVGIERAARWGDRFLTDPQRDAVTIGRLAAHYRELCAALDRPARVGMFREAWIGGSRRDCEEVWAPHALAVHRLYYNVGVYRKVFEPWVDEVRDRADFTIGRIGPGRFLYGSGDDIRATVEEWEALTGADYMALRFRQPGGPGHQPTLDALARFGEEVIAKV
jgi:alkanesulfonate monooxygenase SsuD/methylene tetrahydromethanopterin reductase-like flavin-dependent oxidoreductase (luciferase family)